MKASILALVLLSFLPVNVVPAQEIAARRLNFTAASTTTYWSAASLVHVYFVHDMFTSGERQTLWESIEAWTEAARKIGSDIRFVDAGEAGGLIDCAGCLTITRQGFDLNRARQHVSFNAIRQDEMGRLISAWIAFERAPASPHSLRTLMHQALERGLGAGVALSAARRRS
jgi:hypothetical protein